MARLVLLHGRDPLTRQLAEEIMAGQAVEIAAMRGAVTEIIDELTCTNYGTGCTGDGECEFHPDAVCSADGVCISDPATTGCIASLWTGVGRYDGNPDSYQNLSSLAADPLMTQSRIPMSANGGGGSEALYESIACTVDPSLCDALGCTAGGIDTALRLGLNFPRGPFAMLARHGRDGVLAKLATLESAAPPHLKRRYLPAPDLMP